MGSYWNRLLKGERRWWCRSRSTSSCLNIAARARRLFNVFLDIGQSQTGTTLAFAADVCVRATEYQVDGALFFKNYFEGGYLFRDMVTLEATMPVGPHGAWKIEYQFASERDQPPRPAKITRDDDEAFAFEIPIEQPAAPGIKGRLCVETRFWNAWCRG